MDKVDLEGMVNMLDMDNMAMVDSKIKFHGGENGPSWPWIKAI